MHLKKIIFFTDIALAYYIRKVYSGHFPYFTFYLDELVQYFDFTHYFTWGNASYFVPTHTPHWRDLIQVNKLCLLHLCKWVITTVLLHNEIARDKSLRDYSIKALAMSVISQHNCH